MVVVEQPRIQKDLSWAAFEALRESQATEKLLMRTWELDFMDNSRSARQRMLRTTEDIRTYSPPQKSGD